MNVTLEPSWKAALHDEFEKHYFKGVAHFVKDSYQKGVVYPPPKLIFAAFDKTPFEMVKVVILGQDPYHGTGQANGLAFSVSDGIAVPPSLQNIYKEIESDLGTKMDFSFGNLERWATQGVLLLNATLTVAANTPGSHHKKGWEEFTDAAVKVLSDQREHLVFLLWGAYAQKKGSMIDVRKHLVLNAAHPSPFSAHHGFFGCKHFSKANVYLIKHGQTPIEW